MAIGLRSCAVLAAVLSVLLCTTRAQACGAAYPGGPMVCTMDDAPSHRQVRRSQAPVARLAGSWAFTTTTILFGASRRAELTRHTFFAGTELPLRPGLGLRFGAGGIAAGELVIANGERRAIGPGVSGFFGISKTILDEASVAPFVQVGATLSVSRTATRGQSDSPSFTAFDVRAAATAGKTLLQGWIVPYVTLRAFGGPIYYRYGNADVTGTDLYKYQVAGGLSLARASRVFDVFVEGVPLGERGVSAGIGATF